MRGKLCTWYRVQAPSDDCIRVRYYTFFCLCIVFTSFEVRPSPVTDDESGELKKCVSGIVQDTIQLWQFNSCDIIRPEFRYKMTSSFFPLVDKLRSHRRLKLSRHFFVLTFDISINRSFTKSIYTL